MEQKLLIYNTLTRTKERFTPLHAPNVGMYVCGPADEGAGPQVLVALRGDGRGLCRLLRAGHDLVHDPDRG